MTTQNASRAAWWDGPAAANVLAEQFYDSRDSTTPSVPQVPLDTITWPAANLSAQRLNSAPVLGVYVATDGSVQAIERARARLETAYATVDLPATLGETSAESQRLNRQYQQLANVVILVSLTIAGCTLAASIAAGLTDRKRPHALYYLITAAGIAISLGIIAATFPLLRHITGPEAARNE